MAKNAPPLFSIVAGWVYSGNRQFRIVHATRKKIIVQLDDGPVTLSRSKLERDGFDHVGGTTYRTSRYALPHELGEIA